MHLYGASGHAKVIIEILEACGIPVDGIYDDDLAADKLLGYKVKQFDLHEVISELIIAIGDNKIRQRLAGTLDVKFGKAIHPACIISHRSHIAEGTVVMAGAIVNSSTVIGRHCIINTACSIDHDNYLGDFVHISPNACLAGGVQIGTGTHIGAGATIIPGISVGKWSVIGAGAVVINDIADHCVAVGNPARVIKIID